MSDEAKTSSSEETEVSIDVIDQEEEYKEWLVFARTDFESAKYLNGAPFHSSGIN